MTFIVLQPGPSFTAFGIGENHPDDDEAYTTSRQRIRQAYRDAGRGYVTPQPHLHRQSKQIVPGVDYAWWDPAEDKSWLKIIHTIYEHKYKRKLCDNVGPEKKKTETPSLML